MQTPTSPLENSSQEPPNDPVEAQWTILKILKWTTSYFTSHQIDSPRLTAEILLAHVLDIHRIDLYLRFDQPLTREELAAFKLLVRRRISREPVAYIIGSREFFGFDFKVTPDVLIPRPETEFIVEASLKLIPSDSSSERFRVLDVGTGSGAVIVALAVNRPGHQYFASDISMPAIRIAAENSYQNGVPEAIGFFAGELFGPIHPDAAGFDLIVSNPPYISKGDIAGLAPEVGAHEPVLALDGGITGLDVLEQIVGQAFDYLKPNGTLMLEIGFDQKERMARLIAEDGRYADFRFIRDYNGHSRVVVMRRA